MLIVVEGSAAESDNCLLTNCSKSAAYFLSRSSFRADNGTRYLISLWEASSASTSRSCSGGPSRIAWALVPPMPNELTAARGGMLARRKVGGGVGDIEGRVRQVDVRAGLPCS